MNRQQSLGIVAAIETRLRSHGVDAEVAERLVRELRTELSADGGTSLQAALERQLRQAQQLVAVIDDALQRSRSLTAPPVPERLREPLAERLGRVADERGEPAALDEWLQAIAEALVAGEVEAAARLARAPLPLPEAHSHLSRRLGEGLDALAEGRIDAALDLLGELRRRKHAWSPDLEAGLEVLWGRMLLRHGAAGQRALAHFEQGRHLAPESGLPLAALASYHHDRQETDQVVLMARRAVELSPELPDGFVVLGLWAEHQGDHPRATEFFDQAVERANRTQNPLSSLERLLAPVPAGLLLRLARAEESMPAAALEALDRAMAEPFAGNEEAGEAYLLKGELLQRLGAPPDEVAAALKEAGLRFSWAGDSKRAEPELRRAHELRRDDEAIAWSLSDVLRMRAAEPTEASKASEHLESSLELWNAATERKRPDPSESWTYLNRALISDQLGARPDADRRGRAWEAIGFIECAILLLRDNSYRWALLGHFHRALENHACALDATARALALGPGDDYAREERVIILANLGHFEELREVLGGVADGPWKDSVEAFALAHLGEPATALTKLDQLGTGADLWQLDLRAYCREMSGDPEGAADDFRVILSRRDTPDSGDALLAGSAAYHLGELDLAEEVFNSIRDDPVQAPKARVYLGLCALRRGHVDAGQTTLSEGLSEVTDPLALREFKERELAQLRRSTQDQAGGEQVTAALDQAERVLAQRLRKLESPPTPEQELVAAMEGEGAANGPERGMAWLGAAAGRARVLLESGREAESAELYGRLAEAGFREADTGLDKCVGALIERGDRELREGSADEALVAYRQAQERARDRERSARLVARLAYARLVAGDGAAAEPDFKSALEALAAAGTADPAEELAATCRSLVSGPTAYWRLLRAWSRLAEDDDLPEARRIEVEAAKPALRDYLDERFDLAQTHGPDRYPVTTPIVVELGARLVPPEGTESPLVDAHAPRLRERIQAQLGIAVPGVRFRQADGADDPWRYTVLVDEARVDAGRADPELVHAEGSRGSLLELGIPETAIRPPLDALIRPPGCRVEAQFLPKLVEAGIEASADPLRSVALHLEWIVRAQLDSFVGVGEVEALVNSWSEEDPEAAARVESVLVDAVSLVRLTGLIRALAAERVPITRPIPILDAVRAWLLSRSDDVDEAVRAARLAVVDALPGTEPAARRIPLPSGLEERLTYTRGPAPLALYEAAHELLAFARQHAADDETAGALVTSEPRLRPMVRRILRPELPLMAVLSREESETVEVGAESAVGTAAGAGAVERDA